MHAIIELIATVVVWMAVVTLNQFGLEVDFPRAEPKAERVITRESIPEKTVIGDAPCPDKAAPAVRTTAKTA